jgi:acylphosphatase
MPEAKPARERREVTYSGRVQGVGFRYTARHLAQRHDVAGFVRNLPDGRVELVVEGTPAEIEMFLASIAEQMGDHIKNAAVDRRPATGEFSGFEVRY